MWKKLRLTLHQTSTGLAFEGVLILAKAIGSNEGIKIREHGTN